MCHDKIQCPKICGCGLTDNDLGYWSQGKAGCPNKDSKGAGLHETELMSVGSCTLLPKKTEHLYLSWHKRLVNFTSTGTHGPRNRPAGQTHPQRRQLVRSRDLPLRSGGYVGDRIALLLVRPVHIWHDGPNDDVTKTQICLTPPVTSPPNSLPPCGPATRRKTWPTGTSGCSSRARSHDAAAARRSRSRRTAWP